MPLLLLASMLFTACDNDDLSSDSVLSLNTFTAGTSDTPELDAWLKTTFTDPYNIQFNYRYLDKETIQKYNVIPANTEGTIAIAKLVRHMWLNTYVEAVGDEFLKTYTPRVFQLIGSYQYDSNGSQVLGTAEGGVKIYLFGVNNLDIDNPRINTDDPYESHSTLPYDLNYWFFHTLHHEFCHILTQTKEYDTDFRTISTNYHSSDWINVDDEDAAQEGFVTGYASGEYNEDFAEIYSTYITMSETGWNKILDNAVVYTYSYTNASGTISTKEYVGTPSSSELAQMKAKYSDFALSNTDSSGRTTILSKLAIVRSYFQDTWGIDIDLMREIVLRRAAEVPTMDLRTLD